MAQVEAKAKSRRQIAGLLIAGLVVLGLMAWGVSALMGGKSKPQKTPPKISLVAPPPPPPPPPKIEKKPEPPKEQKELKVEQPIPKPAPPQAAPELKMEGAAGDGPSAFGAGKVTSDDLSKLGKGTGSPEKTGMFNPFNNYANTLKGELQRYLRKNNELRRRRYAVEVHVWVSASGELQRFELLGGTGDADTDEAIQQAMKALSGFGSAPPAQMPQPIRLKIVSGS